MDARQRKGLMIATTQGWMMTRESETEWLVPSQTAPTRRAYTVTFGQTQTCTCADFDHLSACKPGFPCKHIWAVWWKLNEETGVELPPIPPRPRPTFPQEWPSYRKARRNKKPMFKRLLQALCSGLPTPRPTSNGGRPPIPLPDMMFSVIYRVFCKSPSADEFAADLEDAQRDGFISRVPHPNSVFNYMGMESTTPILQRLIEASSAPLCDVETHFAVDGTGISKSRFRRWVDEKEIEQKRRDWTIMVFICGTKTLIVPKVEVSRGKEESVYFPSLVTAAARRSRLLRVSADPNFCNVENVKVVVELGGMPYLLFDSRNTGYSGGLFERWFNYYRFSRDEFMRYYRKQTKAETVVYMIKNNFLHRVVSRTETAITNEILCKVICHNLWVLIREHHKLGLDPVFWGEEPALAEVG